VKQELLRWDGVLEAELAALERKLVNAWRYTLDPSDVHALERRRAELLKSKKQHEKKNQQEKEKATCLLPSTPPPPHPFPAKTRFPTRWPRRQQ
jgi:hypothetical protein